MAARIYEQREADSRGPGSTHASAAAPAARGAAASSDPNLVSKLEADGWLEHVVESGG